MKHQIEFESFLTDLEDEFVHKIRKLVSDAARTAYNQAISDALDSFCELEPKSFEEVCFLDNAETKIRKLFTKT